jgi:hypothetical protein
MMELNVLSQHPQEQGASHLEHCMNACREQFNHLLSDMIASQHQEAHKVEASLFKQLMELGLLLLNLFFLNHHQGDDGETIQTVQGLATRSRPSERSYFSLFGKLTVRRDLYAVDAMSFAPFDHLLNLPSRCYAYF